MIKTTRQGLKNMTRPRSTSAEGHRKDGYMSSPTISPSFLCFVVVFLFFSQLVTLEVIKLLSSSSLPDLELVMPLHRSTAHWTRATLGRPCCPRKLGNACPPVAKASPWRTAIGRCSVYMRTQAYSPRPTVVDGITDNPLWGPLCRLYVPIRLESVLLVVLFCFCFVYLPFSTQPIPLVCFLHSLCVCVCVIHVSGLSLSDLSLPGLSL